jgi:K+-sensing histidine kinase KdpD
VVLLKVIFLIICFAFNIYFFVEFLVHMTNRLRRRSNTNNDSRDQTNAFLDQSGKLSSSHTRESRYHYQQHSINGHCLSSSSSSYATTKRKSSDDPNGGNSKRG